MNNPHLYIASNTMQKHNVRLGLSRYIPKMHWKHNEFILDIGCGSGDITAEILLPAIPIWCRILGVDISKDMIDYAQEFCGNKTKTLDFLHLDVLGNESDIMKLEQKFDKVFSFHCFNWVQDHRKALRNIYKLLRNKGEAVLIFPPVSETYSMYERMAEKPQWEKYMKDVQSFISVYQHSSDPRAEFCVMLEEAGFIIVECKSSEMIFTFEKQIDFKRTLDAINPFVSRIPEELTETYLEECFKEYGDNKNPEGKLNLEHDMIFSYVTKSDYKQENSVLGL